MRKSTIARFVVVCGLCLAFTLGFVALYSEAEAAGGCKCPLVYSPVICSNGKTYSNLCVAQCNRATGCVPVPGYPPPIQ